MIEKYFLDFFFSKNFNKSFRKYLNWINLKFRELKWTKTKLENHNELWKNLESMFCILAYKRLKQQVLMGNHKQ